MCPSESLFSTLVVAGPVQLRERMLIALDVLRSFSHFSQIGKLDGTRPRNNAEYLELMKTLFVLFGLEDVHIVPSLTSYDGEYDGLDISRFRSFMRYPCEAVEEFRAGYAKCDTGRSFEIVHNDANLRINLHDNSNVAGSGRDCAQEFKELARPYFSNFSSEAPEEIITHTYPFLMTADATTIKLVPLGDGFMLSCNLCPSGVHLAREIIERDLNGMVVFNTQISVGPSLTKFKLDEKKREPVQILLEQDPVDLTPLFFGRDESANVTYIASELFMLLQDAAFPDVPIGIGNNSIVFYE